MTSEVGTSEAVALRVATPADRGGLVELATAFYAEDGFTTTPAQIGEHLDELITSTRSHCAVAVDGDDLVGFAITTSTFGLENGLVAELEDLYVAPAHRRQGIATALVDDSAAWARGRGARLLELVVAPNGADVSALVGYYAARGFVDDGRRLLARPL